MGVSFGAALGTPRVAQGHGNVTGKTRRISSKSAPGPTSGRPGPPMRPSGRISPRRPHGCSTERIPLASARISSTPAKCRFGGPVGKPRRPSGKNFDRRPHGGRLTYMHFSRASVFLGLGYHAFSRAAQKQSLRMASDGPLGATGQVPRAASRIHRKFTCIPRSEAANPR